MTAEQQEFVDALNDNTTQTVTDKVNTNVDTEMKDNTSSESDLVEKFGSLSVAPNKFKGVVNTGVGLLAALGLVAYNGRQNGQNQN